MRNVHLTEAEEGPPVNEERFARFAAIYHGALLAAVRKYPDEYLWARGDDLVLDAKVYTVAARMLDAVRRGSYNKDGYAFKAVCKALGIKYTYAAINGWLKGA